VTLQPEVKRDIPPLWVSSCSSIETMVAGREEAGGSCSGSSSVGLSVCETGGDDMLVRKDGVHGVMTRLMMA
jgi:hypothetical protein